MVEQPHTAESILEVCLGSNPKTLANLNMKSMKSAVCLFSEKL